MSNPSPPARLAPLALLVLASCSVSSGSFDFASLSVESTDPAGTVRQLACERLPVLLGSRAHEEFAAPLGLRVTLDATSEDVAVHILGGETTLSRILTADELRDGYVETATVQREGEAVGFRLLGPCVSND